MWLYQCLVFISLTVLVEVGVPPANRHPKEIEKNEIKAQRPSHLEAVPLERDGSLNKEFRKEVLLGDEAIIDDEKNEMGDKEHLESMVKHMFSKADTNKDGSLDEQELKRQILNNTNRHLDEARKESNEAFQTVDENGNGKVEWSEYKTHFLVEKGLLDKEHPAAKSFEGLDRDSKILLQEEKNAFDQADAELDGLDEIEWLSFRHPEHSKVMLREMAEEILNTFDTNKDGLLSEDEFAHVNEGDVTDPKMEQEYIEARRHEFKTMIDTNGDSKASLEELLEFVDPRNERHAQVEVHEILGLADTNGDQKLTLEELLTKAELLAASGFIHPKARLHDDL